jgi:hypothetical protein
MLCYNMIHGVWLITLHYHSPIQSSYFLNFIFYSNYCTLKTTSDLLVQSEWEALNNLQATETTIGYLVPLKY